jgi:hypothetical protein
MKMGLKREWREEVDWLHLIRLEFDGEFLGYLNDCSLVKETVLHGMR